MSKLAKKNPLVVGAGALIVLLVLILAADKWSDSAQKKAMLAQLAEVKKEAEASKKEAEAARLKMADMAAATESKIKESTAKAMQDYYKKFELMVAGLLVTSETIIQAPQSYAGYWQRAQFLYEHERWMEALADLHRVLDIKQLAEAYHIRGLIYYKQEQNDQAREEIGTAIRLKPQEPLFYTNRGIIYADTNNHEQALNDFNKALQLQENNPHGRFQRALLWEKQQKYEAALADFLACQKANPEYRPEIVRTKIADMQRKIAAKK